MMHESSSLDRLREYAYSLPSNGAIEGDQESNLLERLAAAWNHLSGSSEEGTTADKVYRAEKMQWSPPTVSFVLERHGSMVLGSTRAALHYWQVNVDEGTAEIVGRSWRQLIKPAARMDIEGLVQKTKGLILAGESDPSLKWSADRSYAVVLIGHIIPETLKQTTAGRRKRFRDRLTTLMEQAGWKRQDEGTRIGFRRQA